MESDGFWAQLDKGANKYKPITEDEVLDAMKDIKKNIPAQRNDDRVMSVYTGMAGAKMFNTAVKKEAEAQQRMEINQIYHKNLAILLRRGKITEKRYNSLCKMIASSDDETRNMAMKITDMI